MNKPIYATHHRMGAKWHLYGEWLENDRVLIKKIWRDDEIPDYPLAWKSIEAKGRIVTHLVIGLPGGYQPGLRPPKEGSYQYQVDNPDHIFSYE